MRLGQNVFIDSTAQIGENCSIWHNGIILANVILEANVSIGSGTEIGSGSIIGRDSRISAQCFLPSNSTVGRGCFLGPGVRCADDAHPRANNPQYIAAPPIIEDGASVGMGAIILPGIRVGLGAMVGAGAIVTRDVPAHAHVRGEPARVKPYSRIHEETNFDIYADTIRDRVTAGERIKERS